MHGYCIAHMLWCTMHAHRSTQRCAVQMCMHSNDNSSKDIKPKGPPRDRLNCCHTTAPTNSRSNTLMDQSFSTMPFKAQAWTSLSSSHNYVLIYSQLWAGMKDEQAEVAILQLCPHILFSTRNHEHAQYSNSLHQSHCQDLAYNQFFCKQIYLSYRYALAQLCSEELSWRYPQVHSPGAQSRHHVHDGKVWLQRGCRACFWH